MKNYIKQNPWRLAFLILLGLVIGSVAVIGYRVTQIREPNLPPAQTEVSREGTSVMRMESNKEDVNRLIQFFLEDFQKDANVKMKFYLENEALLNGTFKVLGFPVQFYLYFDPYVMEDGNVQLKAKSLSIGALGLPIGDVMKGIQREYDLPEWVVVDPDEKTITLRLDQFQLANGLFVKAEKINLVDDDIRFDVYLPSK